MYYVLTIIVYCAVVYGLYLDCCFVFNFLYSILVNLLVVLKCAQILKNVIKFLIKIIKQTVATISY